MQGKKWAALLAAAVVTGTGFATQPVMAADFTAGITGSADTDAEYVTAGVTTDGKTYTFGEDSSITPASTPAITLQDGMKISAKGHTISLNTTNSDAIGAPKSDYSAIIEADLLDIHAESDSAQVNGIYVSKYWKAKNAALHVVGDVSITAAGKGGTEGIRLGSSSITIDGNVSMKGKDGGYGISGDPIADGIAYMSNNGFMIQSLGGNSPIAVATVNGLLDLKVIGNGVLVNAGGSTFNGQGGTIEVGQGTQNVAYAALRAQNGTINFNVLKDENGAITGAGTNKVNISGNIALNTSATNTTDTAGKDSAINLGLNTADSTLNGVIYNGYGKDGVTVTDDWGGSLTSTGAANVWLANGAVWTNEAWGEVGDNGVYGDTVYPGVAFEGSHVTKLTGGADADHAGVIIQKDSHDTTIDNYSGWTKVIYAHTNDGTEAAHYAAGDTIITAAAEGSGITLSTDNTGITTTDKDQVAKVLNALAGKLTYTGYADGHLTGKVEIADGLTASSQSLVLEDITFTDSGKGSYVSGDTPTPGGKTEFTTAITGDTAADTEYAGNIQDGKYVFEADTTIKSESAAAIAGTAPLTIDAENHTLTLSASGSDPSSWDTLPVVSVKAAGKTFITADQLVVDASFDGINERSGILAQGSGTAEDKAAVLDVTGDVQVTAKGDMAETYGIKAYNNGKITIHGNVSMAGSNKNYGISTGMPKVGTAYGLYATSDGMGGAGSITVDGNTDIYTSGHGIYAALKGSSVTTKGGTIRTNKDASEAYYALAARSGTVNWNMNDDKSGAGDALSTIQGNVGAISGANDYDNVKESVVNIGLSGKDSSWTGIAYADKESNGYTSAVNLYLKDSALWTNESYGKAEDGFTGSHLASLASDGGVIFQKDSNPLTIDHYSGSATLIYAHENDGSKASDYKAGDTTITSAVSDSSITVSTDNSGIDTTNDDAVTNALLALANKVYYSGAIGKAEQNLTGIVQIADGLTSSSKQLSFKDIVWNEATGQGGLGSGELPPAPGEQTQTEFTDNITGERQSVYVQAGVQKEDNSYVFTKDSIVTINQMTSKVKDPNSSDGDVYILSGAAVQVGQNVKNLTVNAENHTLNLAAKIDDGTTPPNPNPGILANRIPLRGIDNSISGSQAVFKVGQLDISVDNTYKSTTSSGSPLISPYNASGIYAAGGDKAAVVDVTGNVNVKAHGYAQVYGLQAEKNGQIAIHGNFSALKDGDNWGIDQVIDGADTTQALYNAYSGAAGISAKGEAASVTVDGKTAIDSRGSGIVARAGGTVNVGETQIFINDNSATGQYYYYGLASSFGTINVNMDGEAAGTKIVNITGNVGILNTESAQGYDSTGKSSVINLGLSGKESSWHGAVINNFTKEDTDKDVAGVFNLSINNGAVWTNEKYGASLGDGEFDNFTYTGSHVTKLTGGADADHAGVIAQNDSHALTFDNYSGWTKIVYAHEGSGAAVENYVAGDTVITKAAEGSGVILATDNTGIDMASKDSVEAALKALAQKITYSAYMAGENNLAGSKVQIAEGLTSSSVTKAVSQTQTGDLGFDKDTGKGVYGGNLTPGMDKPVNPDQPVDPDKPPVDPDKPSVDTDKITEGDYETFVMKGIRSAATTSFHAWRDNMTDFYDASEGADEDGIFAKAYGGKTEADVKGVHETNSYWGGQVGYDKALSSGWHMGAAFDYRDGDSDYLLGGKGDDKLYSLGVYGKKTMADGSYVKVAAKAGRVENEYTVYNELRLKALKGDYKASAYGVTAEYGKTFGTGRAYVTPKVSLAWASVGSKDYTARAGRDTISIDQESYSSLVGRLGFEAGVEHARGGFYAGLAVAHEFDGDISARYNAADGGEKHTSFDGEDTWVELVLGGRYKLSDASQLYADFARDFGGDFEHQWKLNAGLRFSF